MFGPKKPKVSKKDLKKSIVNANDRLRAANASMKLDIDSGQDKLKHIEQDYDSYKKALEDTKEMQVFANNELEGTQLEIAEAQTIIKKALSKIAKLSEEANSLQESNKQLAGKSGRLEKSIALLESKKQDLKDVSANLKAIKKEEAEGQETLELLAIELNDLEAGVESYISRKSAAESEFRASKAKIGREKNNMLSEIADLKDKASKINLVSGVEMGRLDKAIADRMTELQDMDSLIQKKTFDLSTIQSRIGSVEERVKDAEERIEYSIQKEQDRVVKIKGDFKNWKVEALDEVARMKIKKKIENIDRAGLKDVLDG
jgi:chromosome segregation ATPase